MTTTYGILSDIHTSSPLAVEAALNHLKDLGAQRLILNGDLTGEHNPNQLPPHFFLDYILKAAADTNLDTYVQFGSHEEFISSDHILNYKRYLYGNVHHITEHSRIEFPDHHLLFLPGSDVNAGGEYTFGTDLPTGTYLKTKDSLEKIEERKYYSVCAQLIQAGQAEGIFHYENISDLKTHVTDPQKTILICHVPPLSHRPTSVDYAHFIQTHYFNFDHEKDRLLIGKHREFHKELGVSPYTPQALAHLQHQNIPFVPLHQNSPSTIERLAKEQSQHNKKPEVIIAVETKANRGNDELADLIKDLDITKVISGHFHEASHNAHDHRFQAVEQGTFTPSLLWNASYMDAFKAGILRVDGINVAYQNIDLRK